MALLAVGTSLSVAAADPESGVQLIDPNGVAVDAAGALFISDIGLHAVFRLTSDGRLLTVAGTGRRGFSGDAGAATNATLRAPHDLAFDQAGQLLPRRLHRFALNSDFPIAPPSRNLRP